MTLKDAQKYRSWVEIDLNNFKHNWNEIRRLVGPSVRILQVVKADAYGHGAIEISNHALKNGASYLGVANADEGTQLRVAGISAPILIMSPSIISEIDEIIKYNLIPSVSDFQFAKELNNRLKNGDKRIPVHVEIDTGMGRGGTLYYEAFNMIKNVDKLPSITVEGIFSHFSSSDAEDDNYNAFQWKLFEDLLEKLRNESIHIPIKHISNSGGIMNFSEFKLDMVRPGIMTYGIHPSGDKKEDVILKPVMSFKTKILLLKDIPEGYSIGYNKTYVTKRSSKIATIPVGYGDGYGVILSNQGEALIKGKRAPIIGRVSMDMCTVDVSHIPGCAVGDEVVLMGQQGDQCISADDIAQKSKTISYEVLCALGKRAPRVFVHKGRPNAIEPQLRRIFIPGEEKSIARIDNIIRSCLQARTRSEELGDAIYYEMFETLFGKKDSQLELRSGFKYDIAISEYSKRETKSDELSRDYYKVATHVEYIKVLRNHFFIIGCALNNKQLSDFFDDERCEYRWLLNTRSDQIDENDFRVNCVRVDGEEVTIVGSENTGRGYEVWCGGSELVTKLNTEVKVEIEIVTKKRKSSNTFSVYLVYPTRGLEISFNYSGTKLKNVREMSFFAGKHPYPEVCGEKGKWIGLQINDNEWVFPNSGVTFIWNE